MSKKMHESAISEKVRILGIFEITRQHHKFTDKKLNAEIVFRR